MKLKKKKFLKVGFSALLTSAITATTMASAWGGAPVHPKRRPADDTQYSVDNTFDKIFPYYSMECSFTQLDPINGTPGGTGGHALIYIKGVCRDTSDPLHPKLKMCDDGADLSDPNVGVALSADKILENSEYVATEGQQFLFHGDLKPGEVVDETTLARTRDVVVKSGALKAIKVHPEYLVKKPERMSDEEYIAQIGADTDYAVSFARESNCVRVPMNRAQIQAEVDWVNSSNEPYISGAKIYDWNGPGDNCTSFTHDVLAAAGIRKHVGRTHNEIKEVVNILTLQIQVPRNETLATEQAVNKVQDIGTAEEVFNKSDLKETFEKFGTIAEVGGVFEVVPMDIVGNKLYKPAPGAMMLDTPVVDNRRKALNEVKTVDRYSELSANIQSVRDRLVEVQKKRVAVDAADHSDLAEFSRKYNAWVDQSVVSLNQKLAQLSN
jgi:hypothetical protein